MTSSETVHIIENIPYPDLCKTHIQPKMEASLINRWIFARLGNRGYKVVLNSLVEEEDIIPILLKKYNLSGFWKRVLFPFAKLWFRPRLQDKQCMHENCSCVWCKHGMHDYAEMKINC